MAQRPLGNPKQRAGRFSLPRATRKAVQLGKRARGTGLHRDNAYVPPEDWYEPTPSGRGGDYRIVVQHAGDGYTHVVTPDQVRRRLSELPPHLVARLDVVQLSRMTRKKRAFPCYGMQWGSAIYLYPIETGLVEHLGRPPRPHEANEARRFGARWMQTGPASWQLVWTPDAIRSFYLENILLHELGHLNDTRNTSYRDRERFAEWFAVEYGRRPAPSPAHSRRGR